jgi:hypothetical protein
MDVVYKIYKPKEDYAVNYTLPFFFILILVSIAFYLFIMAQLHERKTDWEISKCVPKYLFISGYIKKNEGENVLSTIYDNFDQCIKTYVIPPSMPVITNSGSNRDTYIPRINTSKRKIGVHTSGQTTYPPTSTYPSTTSEKTIYPPTSDQTS